MLRFLVLLIIDKSINVMKYRKKCDASIPNALLMYITYSFQLDWNIKRFTTYINANLDQI